ncbi:MAG: guanitoxin biosynthesis pre-guanitoxin forming N-methyltransferase GntF [bacterium]|nr:guanitoxin biosynthesis pre-guanitoxin forming N-methyltransferase GntF [bacterium]
MSEYDQVWSPRAYLAQYYAGRVTEDEKGISRFVREFLSSPNAHFKEMVEVGCGPTIHHAALFASHVDRIYMADYMESNLEEVKRWVGDVPDAHDWNRYLAEVLERENGEVPTPAQVADMAQIVRSRISGFFKCDILAEAPLGGLGKTFDLVASFYTLECVSRTKAAWKQAMRNLSSLVTPSGWVVLSVLRNAHHYRVKDLVFSTAHINEADMRSALTSLGFIPETIDVEVCICSDMAGQGFDSIVLARAQKGKW